MGYESLQNHSFEFHSSHLKVFNFDQAFYVIIVWFNYMSNVLIDKITNIYIKMELCTFFLHFLLTEKAEPPYSLKALISPTTIKI